MVNFCAVYGCSNRSNREKNRSFFRIPAIIYHSDEKTKNLSRERRQRWLAMIQREDLTDSQIVSTRICSDHFISGKPSALYDTSNIDWLPTLNIGTNIDRRYRKGTYSRIKQRGEKRKRNDTAETLLHLSQPAVVPILALPIVTLKEEDDDRPFKSCESMTYVTMSDMERLERENFNLREENRALTAKLRTLMRLAMVTNRDKILEPPISQSQPAQELPISRTQPAQELPISRTQPAQELPISHTQPAQELPISRTQPVQELPISQSQPAQELPMSNTQAAQELPMSNSQPAQELPISHSQPAQELPISRTQPVQELPISLTQPVQELPISHTQPAQELPISHTQPAQESPISNTHSIPELPKSHTRAVPELHQ